MDYLCLVFVCHTVLSVPCNLVVSCWERADLLYEMFSCVFCLVTFLYGVLGQLWYLIESIPDLFLAFVCVCVFLCVLESISHNVIN